ncbi:MAG: hypothetical protein ACKOK8_05990 [Planctomycetia bacterium]
MFAPLSDSLLPMTSLFEDKPLAAVVEIVAALRFSVEPLSVKVAVLPAVPSFVNDNESTVMAPMSLVVAV